MISCDIIIAAEDVKIGQTEVRVGLIPGGGGTQVLPRLVGEKKAKELIFTGRMISATEAMNLGIINQVVPREELREATQKLLDELLARRRSSRSASPTTKASSRRGRGLLAGC